MKTASGSLVFKQKCKTITTKNVIMHECRSVSHWPSQELSVLQNPVQNLIFCGKPTIPWIFVESRDCRIKRASGTVWLYAKCMIIFIVWKVVLWEHRPHSFLQLLSHAFVLWIVQRVGNETWMANKQDYAHMQWVRKPWSPFEWFLRPPKPSEAHMTLTRLHVLRRPDLKTSFATLYELRWGRMHARQCCAEIRTVQRIRMFKGTVRLYFVSVMPSF